MLLLAWLILALGMCILVECLWCYSFWEWWLDKRIERKRDG